MPGRIAALAIAGLLALVAAGCGSGDETATQVPGPPADVSVPQSDNPPTEASGSSQDNSSGNDDSSSNDSGSNDSSSSDSTDSSATGDTGTSTDSTGTTGTTTDEGGGTAAPNTGDDSATNDTPPPEGSDAQQFEDFCAQNPGAC
jgi:hypothetical protein